MINKINELVKGLNVLEKERLQNEGFNSSFFFDPEGNLTKECSFFLKEGGKKYLKIDCWTSGAYMVEILTGEIFNIKAYGVPDKNKKLKSNLGNIKDYFFSSNELINITKLRDLHTKRHNYLRGGY